MKKYRNSADFDGPLKTTQSIRVNRLTAKNEHDLRHMFISRPDGGSVFRMATDCRRDAPACAENRNYEYKGLCTPSRGYMVPGLYFNWNVTELPTACSGFRD